MQEDTQQKVQDDEIESSLRAFLTSHTGSESEAEAAGQRLSAHSLCADFRRDVAGPRARAKPGPVPAVEVIEVFLRYVADRRDMKEFGYDPTVAAAWQVARLH